MHLQGANTVMELPGLALDGHAHVFERGLQMETGRRYTPDQDAFLSTYAQHLIDNALDGGLLVQPSFLGTDNSYLLAALKVGNSQWFTAKDGQTKRLVFRGVITPDAHMTPDVLARWAELGVTGVRFNLYGKPPSFTFDIQPWQILLSHIAKLGWHVDLHCEGPRLPDILPKLLDHSAAVTVDHFGLPDTAATLNCPGQQAIIDAPRGRVFVKTSGPYRVFRDDPSPLAARKCAPVFRRLYDELGPSQLIWGSDWPWTQFESQHSFTETYNWLDTWLTRDFDRSSFRPPSMPGATGHPSTARDANSLD